MHSQRTWHYVDEVERKKWQNPEEILTAIGIKPGITFMDIGCGNGYFTLPAARMIGPGGHVYGLDTNDKAVEEIRTKAAKNDLNNITLQAGRAEDILFCDSCADIVFFGIVLHDFQDAGRVLKNARRMLKPDGHLVNLDWKKVDMEFGPPFAARFDESTAAHLIESAGFKIDSIKKSGIYHYVITAIV